MTKIQLALDVASTAEAVRLADATKDSIDIIEAGTVLVLNDGLKAVWELREQFHTTPWSPTSASAEPAPSSRPWRSTPEHRS